MDIITSSFCAIKTPHEKNTFISFETQVYYRRNEYLLMFFRTPFLYESKEGIKRGEANHYIIYPPKSDAKHGSSDVGFVNDWIFFTQNITGDLIEKFKLPIFEPFKIGNQSIIEPYIKKIEHEKKYKNKGFEERITVIIIDMLIALGREYELESKKINRAFNVIDSARRFMLENYSEKITIEMLSKRANFSTSRFCVLYNEFFNSTPIDDLLNIRMENAKTMLRFGDYTISEIADMCGFSSVHYFSRKFKERIGKSPTDYRNGSVL